MRSSQTANVAGGYGPVAISHSTASVLTPSELSSIVSLAHSNASAGITAEQQRRAELQAASAARSAKWPNTLQAQRSLKRQQRELHRQQEEARNLVLDAEDAAFRASERQRIVDRANALLYKDRDSVKNLQTGINLAVINRDRSAQLRGKAQREEEEKAVDAAFHSSAETLRRRALAVEDAKAAAQRETRVQLARTQMEQLDAFRARQAAVRVEEVREGERRRQVEEAAARDARLEEERKVQAQRELNSAYLAANADLLARHAEKAKWEAAEAARVARYAEEKEATLQQRRQREEDVRSAKAALTQKMLDVQFAHLLHLREKEGARLERQVEEQREKADAMARRKEELREERIRVENETRQQQMARRRQEREAREAEERQRIERWQAEAEAARAKEAEEGRERRKAARWTMEAQKGQVKEKEAWRRVTEAQEAAEDRGREEARVREDAAFERFAAGKMAELEGQGYDVTPVKLALEAEKIRNTRLKV